MMNTYNFKNNGMHDKDICLISTVDKWYIYKYFFEVGLLNIVITSWVRYNKLL